VQVIQVRSVFKSFSGMPVLAGVDLHVPAGSLCGLVGPGGAGKSVLVKMVASLVRPDSGSVLIGGRDLFSLRGPELAEARRAFGVQFQNYALFDYMTVGDNVAFPLRQAGGLTQAEIARRVERRLADVGLAGAAPLRVSELSGGMRRRVAIARGSVAEAPVMLCDDPTAGLDPVTASRIFLLLRDIQRRTGSTMLVVSHDVDRMVRVCDRFALLRGGVCAFSGTTGEALSSRDPVVAAFFRQEARA
jgi:phospholipid/cholesterol/gamma-HCH transport system ATP-binding protein